ncbi:hypothetical protein [Salinisphaera sp. LB1]|uniref:hypothetical protein n=1 Tax=Salinisphaera sp. LB1 TaxID=2183911 RepID=UPI000D7EA568|nr:hypothetical protein [Salinisphaera sp. LB1]AWN14916.1 hypothetical protein SALB1_0709 [Salinisphaera sp. LB1]
MARRLGVPMLIFAAGMTSAAFGLLAVHQFSPRHVHALMRRDRSYGSTTTR